MMKKSLLYISAFLLFTFSMQAQTTNEGMLYISEDTKFSTLQTLDNKEVGEVYNDGDAYIYSGFNNDGVIDFSQNTGLTRFIGDQNQSLSGSQPSYFYDVLFDNNSQTVPFQLSGWFDISGQANFYQGIVDNNNFQGRIDFRNDAFHINTSDASYVNGEVGKLREGEFIFPIGKDGYYRLAAISTPANPDAEIIGEYFFENSDLQFPHELKQDAVLEINDKEFWTIENNSGVEEDNLLIGLTWRDVTTPDFIIDAAENEALTIVRWSKEDNMWIDQGGTVDLDNQLISTQVSDLGVFTMAILEMDEVNPCHVVVYNAVTPNGDGINDYFRIEDQGDCAKDLHVKVFNRWGVKVFETNNYGTDGDLFDGYSSGRLTVRENKGQLPTGTYFYILEYQYDSGEILKTHKKQGYLYLSGSSGN